MEAQARICPDCGDDHTEGSPCPEPEFAAFWIDGEQFCYDCAEQIGLSFIDFVMHPPDFRCDGCGGKFLGRRS